MLEGSGVHLKRAFGYNEVPLLDDFHSDNPQRYLGGFPWHPHRGIETITCVHQGRVEHGDSMGNSGVINSGDVQWMTAGSGIIHQEMLKGTTFTCSRCTGSGTAKNSYFRSSTSRPGKTATTSVFSGG